jgi:hypothetical protein
MPLLASLMILIMRRFFCRIENEDFSKVVFDLENTGLCKIYYSMFRDESKKWVKKWIRRLIKRN